MKYSLICNNISKKNYRERSSKNIKKLSENTVRDSVVNAIKKKEKKYMINYTIKSIHFRSHFSCINLHYNFRHYFHHCFHDCSFLSSFLFLFSLSSKIIIFTQNITLTQSLVPPSLSPSVTIPLPAPPNLRFHL